MLLWRRDCKMLAFQRRTFLLINLALFPSAIYFYIQHVRFPEMAVMMRHVGLTLFDPLPSHRVAFLAFYAPLFELGAVTFYTIFLIRGFSIVTLDGTT